MAGQTKKISQNTMMWHYRECVKVLLNTRGKFCQEEIKEGFMEEVALDLTEFWNSQIESTVEFVLLSEGKRSFKLNQSQAFSDP